jgi:hypothetical protein
MSDKIARLGIERDNDLMYYIKNGDVWATPRKQKGTRSRRRSSGKGQAGQGGEANGVPDGDGGATEEIGHEESGPA